MWHQVPRIALGVGLALFLLPPLGMARPRASVSPAPAKIDVNPETGQDQLRGPIIVSQIHNAPGWQPDHRYSYAFGPYTRVVNGPGWTAENRSYNPGQPLNAYQLTSPGHCTSAASGGPSGTGTAIKDGTCTWKYLSRVDYISITGWAFDSPRWEKGKTYHRFDFVTYGSPLRAYTLAGRSCVSVVPPSGGGTAFPKAWHDLGKVLQKVGLSEQDRGEAQTVTEGGCHWKYTADILYSSERSYIPTVKFPGPRNVATIQMHANYEAILWNDREYIAGKNGEHLPIVLGNHENNWHGGGEGGGLRGCEAPAVGGKRSGQCYRFIITAAPGESFADSPDPVTRFDPSKGVAIYNDHTYRYRASPAALVSGDPFVDIIGLQLKSVHGPAFLSWNNDTVRSSILEGGSSDKWTHQAALWLDAGPCVVANSLIISHGPIGVAFKYPGILLHDTIVHSGGEGNVAVVTWNKWVFDNTVVTDTAMFGFRHAGAGVEKGTSFSTRSTANVTDAPVGDSGRAHWSNGSAIATVSVIPGTQYGSSVAAAFVEPDHDWRPKSEGPLIGTGRPFGPFSTFCSLRHPHCANKMVFDFDTPDIVGTPRPQAGRYDIGAWQSCPSINRNSRCALTRRSAASTP